MLTSSYLNLLLVCLPLGFWAAAAGRGAVAVFSLNFLALIPLALFLGEVTEVRARRGGAVGAGSSSSGGALAAGLQHLGLVWSGLRCQHFLHSAQPRLERAGPGAAVWRHCGRVRGA